MADGIQIKIDGIKELQNAFQGIENDMQDIVSKAVSQGSAVVVRAAQINVHVVTGNLRRSTKELHQIVSATRVESQVGSAMSYAREEEFRVDGRGSHSFLRLALDDSEAKIKAAMEDAIRSRLARYS